MPWAPDGYTGAEFRPPTPSREDTNSPASGRKSHWAQHLAGLATKPGEICGLGNILIISTDSKIARRVEVADHAVMKAKTGVVQSVQKGRYAFIGGFNKAAKNILPFCIADGFPSAIRAVNEIGLERNGFSPDRLKMIQDAFRTIIRSKVTLIDAIESVRSKYEGDLEVEEMVELAESSSVGLARPREEAHRKGEQGFPTSDDA